MDVIRCNMCGKDNPADTEYCQYCKAKLSVDNGSFNDQPHSPQEDSSDWLGELRKGATDNESEEIHFEEHESAVSEDNVESTDDTPEWLSRIRMRNQTENGVQPGEDNEEADTFFSASDEVRKWLEDLKAQGESDVSDTSETDIEQSIEAGYDHLEESPPEDFKGFDSGYIEEPDLESEQEEEIISQRLFDEWQEDKNDLSEPISTEPEAIKTEPIDSSEIDSSWEEPQIPNEDFAGLTASAQPEEPEEIEPEQELPESTEAEKESAPDLDQEEAESIPVIPAFSGNDLPDWLGEFAESKDIVEEDESLPDEVLPDDEGVPDWLASLKEHHPTDFDKPFSSAFSLEEIEEGTQSGEIENEKEDTDGITDGVKTFESIKDLSDSQELEEEITSPPVEETELPHWTQTIQPESIESIMSESGAGEEETEGPLAGLRGILPSEAIVTHYKKPPIYASNFELSEKQKIYASILENSLSSKPGDKKETTFKTSNKLIFALIGIGLMAILIISLLFSGQNVTLNKEFIPSYSLDFYNQIQALPEDAAVLVGIDYEPGYSGELTPSVNGIIKHLITKNSRIVFVSTIPAGPIIAESLISSAINDLSGGTTVETYDSYVSEKTVNLGYLAGGTVSLQQLALDPKNSAPYSLYTPVDGSQPWESSTLNNINNINDFSAIIFATEKIETGKSWIEQIQPTLENTPLLGISSAQISPLLVPYYDSGQLQGLLSGIYGASAYESISGQPSKGTNYLQVHTVGIIILIISLIIGIFLQIISKFRSRNKSQEE